MVNTHFDWTELHTRVHKTALRELYQVEEILFVGFDNLMKLYRLDIELDVPDEARTSFLKYTSPKIRPQQGDIVSVGDGRIWVLDRKHGVAGALLPPTFPHQNSPGQKKISYTSP